MNRRPNKKSALYFRCGHPRFIKSNVYIKFEKERDRTIEACKECMRINGENARRRNGARFIPKKTDLEKRKYKVKIELIRRARKNNNFIEDVDPLILFKRDSGICGICNKKVLSFDFHVDHIIPISKGGEHSYKNCQISHPSCNHKKKNSINFVLTE